MWRYRQWLQDANSLRECHCNTVGVCLSVISLCSVQMGAFEVRLSQAHADIYLKTVDLSTGEVAEASLAC